MIVAKTRIGTQRAIGLTTGRTMTLVKIVTATLTGVTETVGTMIVVLNWHSSIASLTVTAKPPNNFVAIRHS